MKRRLTLTIAALAVVVVITGACVTPHNALGTSSSACFQGLPVADHAQHDHGRLVGVRAVSGETARQVLEGRKDVTIPTGGAGDAGDDGSDAAVGAGRVCLFAFHGTFGEDSVDEETGASLHLGSYAVVAVTVRDPRTIGSVVLDRLPLRFHHR